MNGQTVSSQLEKSVGDLANLDESELLIELGRRLVETGKEINSTPALAAAQPTGPSLDTAALAGPVDFLQRTANHFIDRFNRQLYGLLCDPEDPDNHVITDAIESGAQNVGLILAGVLIANFAWLPGIAAVIAAILVKRFAKATHSAVCAAWEESLED